MTFTQRQPPASLVQQKGAALLVSLVILLVLTVLALSSMQGTSLQEKMVSSQRDAQMALKGAEAALDAAEGELSGGTLPTWDKDKGFYSETEAVPTNVLDPNTWAGTGTHEVKLKKGDKDKRLESLAQVPRYFIKATEATGSAPSGGFGVGTGGVGDGVQQSGLNGKVYRVVAFSSGASGQAARAVEAYIIRNQ